MSSRWATIFGLTHLFTHGIEFVNLLPILRILWDAPSYHVHCGCLAGLERVPNTCSRHLARDLAVELQARRALQKKGLAVGRCKEREKSTEYALWSRPQVHSPNATVQYVVWPQKCNHKHAWGVLALDRNSENFCIGLRGSMGQSERAKVWPHPHTYWRALQMVASPHPYLRPTPPWSRRGIPFGNASALA